MLFEARCLQEMLKKNIENRQEALNDYASLLSSLDYDAEIGEIYASTLPQTGDINTVITGRELSEAEITKGHGCEYIREKYKSDGICSECSMFGRTDMCYIRASDKSVTSSNIKALKSEKDALLKATVSKDKGTAHEDAPIWTDQESEGSAENDNGEDIAASERERRLLVHILSQTPQRNKTMLPSDDKERARIAGLLNATVTVNGRKIKRLNSQLYEVMGHCAAQKIVSSSRIMASCLDAGILKGQFQIRYKETACEYADDIITYYTELQKEALNYAEHYSSCTEWERRKIRDEVFSYYKTGNESQKPCRISKKALYEGNLSVMDILLAEGSEAEAIPLSEEKKETCGKVSDATDTELTFNFEALDKGDRKLMEMDCKTGSGMAENAGAETLKEKDAGAQPETAETKAKAEVNDHAILSPSDMLDTWLIGSAKKEPPLKENIKIQSSAKPVAHEDKKKNKSKKQKRSAEAVKENPVEEETEKTADKKQGFTFTSQSLNDSLFSDVDWDIAEVGRNEVITAGVDIGRDNIIPIIRDDENGNYEYEVKVPREWLKTNGFVSLDDVSEGETSRMLMYSFMKSYVTGVEVVRTEEDGEFIFLLYFADIGEKYCINADSKSVGTALKHYLANEKLYKKVSECPMAVYARCADLGFMAENLSYAAGYTRPFGTYSPSKTILTEGFSEYSPENWKDVRTSRSDAKQLYFEQALSRSLYSNGRTFPFFEIKNGRYSFINMVREKQERIIVRPQIMDEVTDDEFRKFADDTIRKLEENGTFLKYKVRIVGLDYSQRLLAFAVYVDDYRAFYTCLTRIQIRIFNSIFRYRKIMPQLKYDTERYAAANVK